MDDLIAEIKEMITEYDADIGVSGLVINLAIETFKSLRNYPNAWGDEQVLADLEKNKAKIAMAAIEIDSKNGAENQISHNENGTSRTYSEYILAYKDVVGFANCI